MTCCAGCTAPPRTWASATWRRAPRREPAPPDELEVTEDPADALRDRLRAAVAAEDFELAAELRDRLRTLEGVE